MKIQYLFYLCIFLIASENQASICRKVIPEPASKFNGIISLTYKESYPDFPKPINAPKEAPNVLLILLDDLGFGQPSTFGGPIPTPHS